MPNIPISQKNVSGLLYKFCLAGYVGECLSFMKSAVVKKISLAKSQNPRWRPRWPPLVAHLANVLCINMASFIK